MVTDNRRLANHSVNQALVQPALKALISNTVFPLIKDESQKQTGFLNRRHGLTVNATELMIHRTVVRCIIIASLQKFKSFIEHVDLSQYVNFLCSLRLVALNNSESLICTYIYIYFFFFSLFSLVMVCL